MLIFWSLVRNSVVLAVYLLFSVACFLTVHEHLRRRVSCYVHYRTGWSDDVHRLLEQALRRVGRTVQPHVKHKQHCRCGKEERAPLTTTSVAKNSIRWYKVDGSPIGGLPSAGDVFPGFLCFRGRIARAQPVHRRIRERQPEGQVLSPHARAPRAGRGRVREHSPVRAFARREGPARHPVPCLPAAERP